MKRLVGIAAIFLSIQGAWSQQSVRLDSCVAWTKRNYPLLKQNGVLEQMSDVNVRAINENWLPKLSLMGQAVYNTEVIKLSLPGMPAIPHDTYLTSLGVEQLIYDGGQIRQQKNIDRVSTDLDNQRNEVEMYKLVDRVNQLYVGVLLAQENLKMLDIFKSNLENRRKNIQAAVNNGMALASSLDELDVEILKADQNIFESRENLRSLLKTLSILTHQELTEFMVFDVQPIGGAMPSKETIARPELKMLSLQEQLVDERYKLTNKMALPKVFVSLAGNYGRPGPNFINQDLRFYGSATLGFKWNISSLYGLNREKEKMELNKEMVDIQRETFLLSVETALVGQRAQISTMQTLIDKDKTIIDKRTSIVSVAASQLDNGKITVTNYLLQLNEEMAAKLNKKIHEIKLMNAVSNYNTTIGLTNF